MRSGDHWFITGFDEINGGMISWDIIKAYRMLLKFLDSPHHSDSDDD